MPNLALLDLIAPYVLRGENLGAQHAALSVVRVVSYETATGSQLTFDLVSAGVSSLDEPGDIGVAELISMSPPYPFVGGDKDREPRDGGASP